MQKEQERITKKNRERNRMFQQVGLDGVALLELFHMEPGPKFGRLLKQIHESVIGEADMPAFPGPIRSELDRRVSAFYQNIFKSGI